MGFLFLILQTFLLVFALGVDALICSFSYGVNKIRISMKSMIVINLITLLLLATGITIAQILEEFLPSTVIYGLAFLVLFFIGLIKIFEGTIKSIIKRHDGSRNFNFSLFNFGFVLQVFAQPELADSDASKELSITESVPLAFALGFDGLSVGLSVGLMTLNIPLLFVMSFVVGIVCVAVGSYLGRKASQKISFDLSILSGLILILIAILNVF